MTASAKPPQHSSSLGFFTVGVGDSYNDTRMLAEADRGIPTAPLLNAAAEFPQFPVATDYTQLSTLLAPQLVRTGTASSAPPAA